MIIAGANIFRKKISGGEAIKVKMKLLLKRIFFVFTGLLALLFFSAGYAYFIEPRRLITNENNLNIPRWNQNLNKFKVVAISDIHGGSNYVNEEKIRLLVEETNRQNPDIIVLLGDYVSQTKGKSSELKMPSETVAENLKGFKAKYGVFAVIGNHDWWFDEKKIRFEFERAGIKVLENAAEAIQVGSETVWIWGVEDYWKNRRVPTDVFDKIPKKENIIAITHNPDSLLKSPAEISLMVAGHSHGGQVNFPFYGPIPFVNDPRFMKGEAVVDGKRVFVTSGVGCTGPQIRFGVPPEIAVINLFSEN